MYQLIIALLVKGSHIDNSQGRPPWGLASHVLFKLIDALIILNNTHSLNHDL